MFTYSIDGYHIDATVTGPDGAAIAEYNCRFYWKIDGPAVHIIAEEFTAIIRGTQCEYAGLVLATDPTELRTRIARFQQSVTKQVVWWFGGIALCAMCEYYGWMKVESVRAVKSHGQALIIINELLTFVSGRGISMNNQFVLGWVDPTLQRVFAVTMDSEQSDF